MIIVPPSLYPQPARYRAGAPSLDADLGSVRQNGCPGWYWGSRLRWGAGEDDDRAWSDAERIAKENEDLNTDGHLELNGNKVQNLFAGIRKVIQVETDSETAQGRLFSGVEATYSVMEVDSLAEVDGLVSGEAATVLYRE